MMSALGISVDSKELWKSSDLIEKKLGSVLDRKVASSTKQVLLDRIKFKEASNPDPFYQELKKKYTPLNRSSTKLQNNGPLLKNHSTSNVKPELNNTKFEKDELPPPKFMLFEKNKVQLQWKTVRNVGPGLYNLGNTCFLNSVIQVLTYTPPLVNYLATQEHTSQCVKVGFCMLCELQRHVLRTFSHQQSEAIKPLAILHKLKFIAKHLRFGQQEDSHEFLRYVVDGMTKSCLVGISDKLDLYTKSTTVVHQIFGGYYRSQVTCERCQHTSNKFDPLMEVLLDIKNVYSVYNALQKLISVELLNGDNMYLCPRCKLKVPAKKRIQIHEPPNVLTMCLKRFDCHSLFASKINKDISYPETLNLRPFLSIKQGCAINFKLFAVLVHAGYSCNSGHYYCFVKAANGSWYQMNDASVRQVSLKTVLGQQAYLLFYIKDEVTKQKNGSSIPSSIKSPQVNGHHGNKSKTLNSKQFFPKIISEPTVKTHPLAKPFANATSKTTTSACVSFLPRPTSIPKERDKIAFTLNQNSLVKIDHVSPSREEIESVSRNFCDDVSEQMQTASQPQQFKESDTNIGIENVGNSTDCKDDQVNDISSSTDGKVEPILKKTNKEKDTLVETKESEKNPREIHATTKWIISNHEDLVLGSTAAEVRERTPSLSSEISNGGSIASKTGEWSVSDRGITQEFGPRLPERQHAGWKVSSSETVGKGDDNEGYRKLATIPLEKTLRQKHRKKRNFSKNDDEETRLISPMDHEGSREDRKKERLTSDMDREGSREDRKKERLTSDMDREGSREDRKREKIKRLKKLKRGRDRPSDGEVLSDDIELREKRKKDKKNKRKKRKHRKEKLSDEDTKETDEVINTSKDRLLSRNKDDSGYSSSKKDFDKTKRDSKRSLCENKEKRIKGVGNRVFTKTMKERRNIETDNCGRNDLNPEHFTSNTDTKKEDKFTAKKFINLSQNAIDNARSLVVKGRDFLGKVSECRNRNGSDKIRLVQYSDDSSNESENVVLNGSANDRVTSVNDRVTSVNDRVTSVNDRVTSVNDRVTSVNDRVTSANDRVTSVNGKCESSGNNGRKDNLRSYDERKNIVDVLLENSKVSSNYGGKVERWDGQKEDNAVKEDRTKRRRDFWDEEYDKGKQMKRRKNSNKTSSYSSRGRNSFQKEYDRRRMKSNGCHSSSSNGWYKRGFERHSWRDRR
ncbi:uncharacterized protein LOC124449586 isoform X3 [Xenia sp. Carnegie-2017]|uniref:uncharacterized protein LOC124449586 isoform X3 n=1 Tax=Xenia sp. Carnegie-2017 TaxID=2897299 RepID=UPI001F03F9D7|nr:uncharacterized protein LOC124449586 isoform X3 [Xenia sp. Carnegie-2017]